jgi:hypothetical protein
MGNGLFAEMSLATGAAAGTHPNVTWGNSLVDFDNDGDRDIFIACGRNSTTHLRILRRISF